MSILLTSAGWGAASPVAGLIVANFGEMASFNANLLGGILQFLPVLLLPTDALKAKKMQKLRENQKQEVGSAPLGAEAGLIDVHINLEADPR